MLDVELLRTKPELVKEKFSQRGEDVTKVDTFLSLDKEWRELKGSLDSRRAEKNKITKEIGAMLKEKKDASELIKKSKEMEKEIKSMEDREEELRKAIKDMLLRMPNLQDGSVPMGKDENDNVEVKSWGKPAKSSGDVRAHWELPLFDFERGAKLGGHRFTVMYGDFAKLERALINFMLNLHALNGYKEVWGPHLVRREVMTGTGQLPKFEEDLYKTDDGLWLIPTAEVMLGNLHREEVLDEKELPLHYVAYTPSYRKEAGAYGKDIKGFLRQHQFDKVELFSFTLPEKSWDEHERMLSHAEAVLQELNLPYRVVNLCTGDLGFSAAKTYDIEVWLPGQDRYREISSVSNCLSFQSRRMNLRFRRGAKIEWPHTLNGSGLAVGRALIAVVENYQEDKGIVVPEKLVPYMGKDYIEL
ncbi:MAG: serine--tRNA ligase [Methanobacteriota archaeon]|nr:MAG: serine--tRNA ligase [Euryarchaeota archaeon]